MLGLRCEKRFGDFQLKADVLLDATATCIFGPSGCGKTTIARMAAGLLSPDAGEIRWGDDLLFSSDARINRPPRERGIAYVPQDVLLFPHMTVRKNLLYGFERTAPSRRAIHPDDVISLLELGAMLDKNPHQLSGGQAQRVAIGRALLSNPNLLVMDEPLSSLDRALKRRILAYLREIPNRFGVRLMYVTHAIDEIFGVGEKVLLMRPGEILAYGPPEQLFDDPALFATISTEGYTNHLTGKAVGHPEGDRLIIDCGAFQLDPGPRANLQNGQPAAARIHARNIILATEPPVRLSAQNVISGRVSRLATAGGEMLVHIDSGQSVIAEVTPRAVKELELREGQSIYWIVKSHSIAVDA